MASTNPYLTTFASEGVILNNYYGLTHPSQPNYIAVAGGDYFGLNDNTMISIPSSYKTVIDLFEAKGGITWRAYQESAPTACYTGYETGGLYFRKHNPFINYDSIALNSTRCNNIVPATQLQTDLIAGNMPNYAFYTPNLIDDGQNTTVADAAQWLSSFLTPLLTNKSFINNTLVVVTFDESEDYDVPNRVYTLLLGDVVASLKGTTDSTFYTHYSLLSTVEANWDLGNLGRQDSNMTVNNVFDFVAKAAGITTNNNISMANAPPLNGTEPGFLAGPTQPFGSKPSPSSATGTTPKTTIAGSSTGAVIGGVVGAAVFVAVIVGYILYRKRQSKRTGQQVQSQKWEVPQQNRDTSPQKIHIQHPQNPGFLPMPQAPMTQAPMMQAPMAQAPMSQAPVFQQQFVFSSHPAPKVSTYGHNTQQQQQQQYPQQQPVPLVWEPQPFVPSAAPSGAR